MSKIKEECGVFGIYSPEETDVAVDVYYALHALQHRGQESAGIVVNKDGLFKVKKDDGLVNAVFTNQELQKLGTGNMAIGHVRYATAQSKGFLNAQPIVVNHVKGHMALAHNGSIVNSAELRKELELNGAIFHMNSDTEIISYLIIKERLTSPSIEEAVNRAVDHLVGAFSLVIMSPSKLIAVRDKNGFRPLCYGKTENGGYAIASESCALTTIGAEFVRDIEPGEILVIDKDGVRSIKDHCNTAPKKSCIFEYIYFARPDSTIDGINVHNAKVRAGKCLAQSHPVDADLVIGVPDSGIDAAIGYSMESKIPYEIGFIKSKYIARTFIAPTQKQREKGVRMKLSAISRVVKDRKIVMVDDSIVRGTTCAQIITLLRDAGAKEVHVRISAPPFLNPCYYGTDIDSRDKLIACKMSIDEIRQTIGADSLGFLEVKDLCKIVKSEEGVGYCDACFTNNYPTDLPSTTEQSKFTTAISLNKGEK